MRSQTLVSCANCWFNGLQYGSVGIALGYCTEHKVILRKSDETTCGKHIRKDLLIEPAQAFQSIHKNKFPYQDEVVVVENPEASSIDYIEKNSNFIRDDPVGDVVADYGEYDTKIESLAQLKTLGTFRSELAMLSLARAYTDRCVTRGGTWRSGLHIFWWTKRRILEAHIPPPKSTDFRYFAAGNLARQIDLAEWSLMMFRLTYISDIGSHAASTDDPVRELHGIAEQAAADTEIPSKRKLLTWLNTTGKSMLERALPERRYKEITEEIKRNAAKNSLI